jgi:hypothetical protein
MRCRIPLVASLTALAAAIFLFTGCGDDSPAAPAEFPNMVGNWDGVFDLSGDPITVSCDAVLAVFSQDAGSWSGTLSVDQSGPCAGMAPEPVNGTIRTDSQARMRFLQSDLAKQCAGWFRSDTMTGALTNGVLTLEATWLCGEDAVLDLSFTGTK